MGIMEKKMETLCPFKEIYRGLSRDNGKEHGNYYGILGLYWAWGPLDGVSQNMWV